MKIHDLAAATAFYANDDRVTRVDDGYVVRDGGREWAVTQDDHLYWRAYARSGEEVSGRFDTPDEAIHALIGDPR